MSGSMHLSIPLDYWHNTGIVEYSLSAPVDLLFIIQSINQIIKKFNRYSKQVRAANSTNEPWTIYCVFATLLTQ